MFSSTSGSMPSLRSRALVFTADASCEESQPQLQIQDFLALYADGLLEARNPQCEIFSFDRLATLVANRPSAEQA
jgi:serine phosphatase RsbU (regulator of sigma subunit)